MNCGWARDLFVNSLWREIRLIFSVFAGVVNVAQRVTRLTFLVYVLSVSSPNPSVDVFPRILTGLFVPPLTSVNHLGVLLHGETQVAPTFIVEDILLLVLAPELC